MQLMLSSLISHYYPKYDLSEDRELADLRLIGEISRDTKCSIVCRGDVKFVYDNIVPDGDFGGGGYSGVSTGRAVVSISMPDLKIPIVRKREMFLTTMTGVLVLTMGPCVINSIVREEQEENARAPRTFVLNITPANAGTYETLEKAIGPVLKFYYKNGKYDETKPCFIRDTPITCVLEAKEFEGRTTLSRIDGTPMLLEELHPGDKIVPCYKIMYARGDSNNIAVRLIATRIILVGGQEVEEDNEEPVEAIPAGKEEFDQVNYDE
jgi:hypothetical protein